jgi:hypothetical protein
MAFITLGKGKIDRAANGILLVLLVGYAIYKLLGAFGVDPVESAADIAKSNVGATYHEVEVTRDGLADYSRKAIEDLVKGYLESEKIHELKNKLQEKGVLPATEIVIYEDDIDHQAESGWVVRFEISTVEVGYDESMEVAKAMGIGFINYVREIKNIKSGET